MTALTRWNPFEEMDAMQNRLSSLFNLTPVRSSDPSTLETEWTPLVDVIETADDFEISAELPGVSKDGISVTLENGYLTISGKRNAPALSENARSLYAERAYGPFSRSVELPNSADANQVQATFRDGVLSVRVPKAENAKPRQISISSE